MAGSGVGMDASGFLLWVAHSVYWGFVGRTGRAEFTGVGLLTDLLPKRFFLFLVKSYSACKIYVNLEIPIHCSKFFKIYIFFGR